MKFKYHKQLLLLVIIFLLCFLSGTAAVPKASPYRYVTGAELIFFQPDRHQTFYYTDPGKLSSLLTCMRLAAPYGQVKTAEANPDAHHYRITLQYSDDTQNVYHLQDYRYLSKDGKTWQKVKPDNAYFLYLFMQLLPPDE